MAIPNTRVNQFIEDKDTRVSVGIKLPFGRQPGSVDGYFASTKSTIDAVKEDIKLLLKHLDNVLITLVFDHI